MTEEEGNEAGLCSNTTQPAQDTVARRATQRAETRHLRPRHGALRLQHGRGQRPRHGRSAHDTARHARACVHLGVLAGLAGCALGAPACFLLSTVSESLFEHCSQDFSKKKYKNFKNFLMYDLIYKIFILHLL